MRHSLLRYERAITSLATTAKARPLSARSIGRKVQHTILRLLRRPLGLEADARMIGATLAGFAIVAAIILLWRQSRNYFQRTKAESTGD
ncbi:MAG: hypothetical protein ABSD98_07330 [Candidatus Korobacteraceae bacterium]